MRVSPCVPSTRAAPNTTPAATVDPMPSASVAPHRVPLSVLDLSPLSAGASSGDALAASTRLARHADELGFARFWVAEHHNMPAVASTSPAVLIAHLAA